VPPAAASFPEYPVAPNRTQFSFPFRHTPERIFVVLYALSAVYFAGVMVRLMLTLTPIVVVCAAVAMSTVFDVYFKRLRAGDEEVRGCRRRVVSTPKRGGANFSRRKSPDF
jgi:asparagine N-glycosylation enzyme membrane subunit Stt3